ERYPGLRRFAVQLHRSLLSLKPDTGKKWLSSEWQLSDALGSSNPAQGNESPFSDGETFFGYYDISPWSPNEERLLVHCRLEGRRDLDLLMVERNSGEVSRIATSHAWNYQQGSRLQWMSNS